jgi:DNA-binding transcriptional LysR family regulator
VELYQLRTFLTVAREGNLTRAADKLFLSIPAVSAQIKSLEDELGLRLFDRTARGMSVTRVGQLLVTEAEATVTAAGRVLKAASDARDELTGEVCIGTLSDSVPIRLGEVLVALSCRHPKVRLTVRRDVSGRILQRVRSGELDGGFALTEEISGSLAIDRLAQIDLVLALPTRYAQRAEGLSLEDLAELPWIVSVPECALHAAVLDLFRPLGRQPRVAAVADSDGSLRSLIVSGAGVGVLRRSEVESEEIVAWPHWSGSTWLCWVSQSGERGAAVSTVRDIVLQTWKSS